MTTPVEPPRTAGVKGWLLRDLPYAAMLGLAVGGIVLTSFRGSSTHYYWMALAPIYGLISIVSGWGKLDTGAERMQLVVTQALHWLAFLGGDVADVPARGARHPQRQRDRLTLLILLALGTFVAGVHAGVWRICAVGVFLAVSVPAVAWIQESAMLILVSVLLLLAVGLAFWWMWRRESKRV